MTDFKKEKILCVDDSKTFRALLHFAFADYPNVQIVGDSKKALEQAAREALRNAPFEAFVLDIEMGPPDGFETARRLRKMPAYQNTPIVFLTATADESLLHQAMKLGNGVILKIRRTADQILTSVTNMLSIAQKRGSPKNGE